MQVTCKTPATRTARASAVQGFRCRHRLVPIASSKDNAVRELQDLQKALSHKLRDVKTSAQSASAVSVAAPDTAQPSQTDLKVLTQDTFYQYLQESGDRLVVVDFYTDWCGPCKVIYPQLLKLAEKYENVNFAKFNCNKSNKELGVKLNIKVAPTFHLYRSSQKVAEMTGAKVDKLVELIEANMN